MRIAREDRKEFHDLKHRWRDVLGTPACGLAEGQRDMLRKMMELSNQNLFLEKGELMSWPAREALAAYARVTVRYVSLFRREMVKRGILVVLSKGGHGTADSTRFSLNEKWLIEAEANIAAAIKSGPPTATPRVKQGVHPDGDQPKGGQGELRSSSSYEAAERRGTVAGRPGSRVNSEPSRVNSEPSQGELSSSPESCDLRNLDSRNPHASHAPTAVGDGARGHENDSARTARANGADSPDDEPQTPDTGYEDTLANLMKRTGEAEDPMRRFLDWLTDDRRCAYELRHVDDIEETFEFEGRGVVSRGAIIGALWSKYRKGKV